MVDRQRQFSGLSRTAVTEYDNTPELPLQDSYKPVTTSMKSPVKDPMAGISYLFTDFMTYTLEISPFTSQPPITPCLA